MSSNQNHIPADPFNPVSALSDEQKEADSRRFPLLSAIDSPEDLRKLPVEKLPEVCSEIRSFLIDRLSNNPGHFASSMGSVEIITALHYVFNTPDDHLVFDVGHQAYSHKLLTGRRDAFATQRTLGGLSGFPNPDESKYDSFIAGHAGNSISAALGMAIADKMTPGHEKRKTVALIGDASISNGLAFEGLNNASNNPNDLLIILNDNEMSIDDNVGALHAYLSELTTSERYNRLRYNIYQKFREKGLIGDAGKRRLLRFNNAMKSLISGDQNIFEGLNIRYFGPFDGHDVQKVVKVLKEIKDMTGPRILHLRTLKGKGFPNAEKDPTTWHAPGLFDPSTGERHKKNEPDSPLLWQQVFGNTMVELADMDNRVVGITAAMPSGTSMGILMSQRPGRGFDVGISEGHAVTFAGGLASGGKRPFVAIYSSFLQRAYDNVIHDVAIQGLPVTFCIDRAGVVGEDGVTHHGLYDLVYLRCIPGMRIASPADEETLRNLMFSQLEEEGPLAVRYPRGKATSPDWKTPMKRIPSGKGRMIRETENPQAMIMTVGPALHDALKASDILESDGIRVEVADMIWVKPLDEELLRRAMQYPLIVTVEDGAVTGGFGSAVSEWLTDHDYKGKIIRMGVPDKWVHQGKVAELKELCGYDAAAIVSKIKEVL
ncbi:MAG: 1-deoxy-D-xylulose-5-phosphate synthase [Bacteroides sp.]|nr:1-deoxy-D-xylulose-5-phosphate synthase [Bacteroides sp.]